MAEVMSIARIPLGARGHASETTRAERSVEQILLWKRKEGIGPFQPIARVNGADGPCLVAKPDL